MANFKEFIPILQKVEGGYQNLSSDTGNYNSLGQRVGTNFGISAKFYEDIINRPPTVADMKAITKIQAEQIYKKYFWDDVQGDVLINQSVANIIADGAVNGGEGSIGRIVQRVLVNDFGKKLTIDGDIGLKTAAAINSVNQKTLFDKIKISRGKYYASLDDDFYASWMERLQSFIYSEKKQSPSGSVA
jgi:lysozyme family protein